MRENGKLTIENTEMSTALECKEKGNGIFLFVFQLLFHFAYTVLLKCGAITAALKAKDLTGALKHFTDGLAIEPNNAVLLVSFLRWFLSVNALS